MNGSFFSLYCLTDFGLCLHAVGLCLHAVGLCLHAVGLCLHAVGLGGIRIMLHSMSALFACLGA